MQTLSASGWVAPAAARQLGAAAWPVQRQQRRRAGHERGGGRAAGPGTGAARASAGGGAAGAAGGAGWVGGVQAKKGRNALMGERDRILSHAAEGVLGGCRCAPAFGPCALCSMALLSSTTRCWLRRPNNVPRLLGLLGRGGPLLDSAAPESTLLSYLYARLIKLARPTLLTPPHHTDPRQACPSRASTGGRSC